MRNWTSNNQTSSSHIDAGTLHNVRSQGNDGFENAASKLGEAVEDNANAFVDKTKDLLSSVAQSGHYLRETEAKTLAADLVAVVKRHPILAMAMGVGFGLFVGKIARR